MLSRSLRPPAFGRPGRATEQCNQPWGCQWWQSRPRCKATNRSQWSQAVTAACKHGPRSAAAAGCDCDRRQTVLYCNCVQLASYSSAPKGACGGPSCARDRIHAAYRPEHCSSAASPVIHESAGHRALTTPPRAGPAGSRTIVVCAHLASHGSIGPAVNVLGLHKREGMGTGRFDARRDCSQLLVPRSSHPYSTCMGAVQYGGDGGWCCCCWFARPK
jgi:hypothetical protein